MNFARRVAFISLFGALSCSGLAQTGYQVKPNHPRPLLQNMSEVARRYEGPLADDYRVVKDRADAAAQRIYPSRVDSVGVRLFSNGGPASATTLEAWEMMPSNPF